MHVVFYETDCDKVAPPGNQAANGENKLQPVAMGGPGLLDLCCYSGYVMLSSQKSKTVDCNATPEPRESSALLTI